MNSENKQEPVPNDTTKLTEPTSVPNVCCGIYGLRNKINGKWYVGQSLDIYKRWDKAYRRLNCKSQPKIRNALLKYGYDAFEKVILERLPNDIPTLNEREIYWIKFYNSVDDGYNLTAGGNRVGKNFTTTGWKHSEETKERLRQMRIGKKYGKRPAEVREKIAKSLQGIKRSDETKEKCRRANVGKTLSQGHKQKISIALKGRFTGTENSYYTYRTP